jgi:hypothetical protein
MRILLQQVTEGQLIKKINCGIGLSSNHRAHAEFRGGYTDNAQPRLAARR